MTIKRKLLIPVAIAPMISLALAGCDKKGKKPAVEQPAESKASDEHPSNEHPSNEHPSDDD